MNNFLRLSKKEIVNQYNLVKKFHAKYLKKIGVELPKLFDKNKKFTRNALALVYLSLGYPATKVVSKNELTKFIRHYYPDTLDVQQGRHLGAQSGWWIVAGGRDNIVENVKRGAYKLYTLEQPYPDFKKGHRISNNASWGNIKMAYNYRCATCGSRENEPHFHWPGTKTKLQMAHKDPNKPLTATNIIPQCQKCNRADRNRWVYDDKGRVIKLADAKFVKNFDKNVRWKIYKILCQEFNKKNFHVK